MAQITKITLQKNNKRVNIFLDGEFAFGVNAEVAARHDFFTGKQIQEDKLKQVIQEEENRHALDRAMAYISKKPRTNKECMTYLDTRGYSKTAQDFVLARMQEYGFLDDQKYADMYIDYYGQKQGVYMLKQKLMQRGVDKDIVQDALEDLQGQQDAAQTIAQKYMRGKERNLQNKQKLYRYLLSKGFSYEDAKVAADNFYSQDEF